MPLFQDLERAVFFSAPRCHLFQISFQRRLQRPIVEPRLGSMMLLLWMTLRTSWPQAAFQGTAEGLAMYWSCIMMFCTVCVQRTEICNVCQAKPSHTQSCKPCDNDATPAKYWTLNPEHDLSLHVCITFVCQNAAATQGQSLVWIHRPTRADGAKQWTLNWAPATPNQAFMPK